MSSPRGGSTLIVVSGMAMLLLSLALAFIMRMRSDAQQAVDVLHDGQARAMLAAAMSYVCEASRIGWGRETFGWNDIRDHAIGPRFRDGTAAWAPPPTPTSIPEWPAPGSVAACPMYVMKLPPWAVKPIATPNPIVIVKAGEPIPEGGYRDAGSGNIEDASGTPYDSNGRRNLGDFSQLDPVPSVPTWAAFQAGDRDPIPGTREQGWFRVYRETAEDHNGVVDPPAIPAPANPYYDTVDLNATGTGAHPNLSVFVVTCGSGATAACRDFADAQARFPGLFPDQQSFDLLRAQERVYWFRIEWWAYLGDSTGWASWTEGRMSKGDIARDENPPHPDPDHYDGPSNYDAYYGVVAGHFGSIRWIQRLDREPPNW